MQIDVLCIELPQRRCDANHQFFRIFHPLGCTTAPYLWTNFLDLTRILKTNRFLLLLKFLSCTCASINAEICSLSKINIVEICYRFAVNLVYYGISINSVELVGNKYMNFILTSLVEVPAVIFAVIMLDRIKRRTSQSSAFILSGLTCIISEFIPPGSFCLISCESCFR